MITPVKTVDAQSYVFDMLASTREIVHHYTALSGKNNKTLGYLPWLHWYQAGRGHVQVRIGSTLHTTVEVLRKLCSPNNDDGETKNASTVDWCNKVIFGDNLGNQKFIFDWQEHFIPFVPPGPVLLGPTNAEQRYVRLSSSWPKNVNYESETEFTLSFLALPPGYQWEIWRKRKKRMESFSQVHTENDRAKMRFGHYVLYDRLALGETVRMVPYYGDKDIPHHAPSIRFAVFNNGTGARSFLSSETVVAQGRNIVKVVA